MSTAAPAWSNGGVQSPITQSGRVVLNAQKDEYSIQRRRRAQLEESSVGNTGIDPIMHTHGGCDDDYSIMSHEIACHDSDRRYEHRMARHESVQVVTSANGFSQKHYSLDPNENPDPTVSFMGIAGSRARHNERDAQSNETDCVVQIGGLCTIINNGPKQIRVNEWVCWDFPQSDYNKDGTPVEVEYFQQQGVPFSKRQFIVRGHTEFLGSVLGGDQSSRLTSRNIDPLLTVMEVKKSQELTMTLTAGRIFGKAMNTATVGGQLDILLGAHCM